MSGRAHAAVVVDLAFSHDDRGDVGGRDPIAAGADGADLRNTRAAGFDDVDISDINGVCAYFNMLKPHLERPRRGGKHALT